MARPCTVCLHPQRQAIEQMMVSGASDYAIVRQFPGLARVSVLRHRTNHVAKVARDMLRIIERGSPEREQRQALAKAAAASDELSIDQLIEAVVGTRAQLQKLGVLEAELGEMRGQAVASGALSAGAALASSTVKTLEYGSKLAGHPSFSPAARAQGPAESPKWTIQMVFPNANKVETISVLAAPNQSTRDQLAGAIPTAPPVIEGAITPEENADLVSRVVHQARAQSVATDSEPDEED
jgi:hypothetical protein